VDAIVVSFWYTGTSFSWMALETDTTTCRRKSTCFNSSAFYISVIRRKPCNTTIGEFARCGVLKHYDNVSFPKAIGTVVSERAIDSILYCLLLCLHFFISSRCSIFFLMRPEQASILFFAVSHSQDGLLQQSAE